MARPRHTPERTIAELHEADVKIAEVGSVARACNDIAVTVGTDDRWRSEYGGLKVDRAKRLEGLKEEDARLKRPLGEAELDKAIIEEAASGQYRARRSSARRSGTRAGRPARIASRGAGRARCSGRAARPGGGPP